MQCSVLHSLLLRYCCLEFSQNAWEMQSYACVRDIRVKCVCLTRNAWELRAMWQDSTIPSRMVTLMDVLFNEWCLPWVPEQSSSSSPSAVTRVYSLPHFCWIACLIYVAFPVASVVHGGTQATAHARSYLLTWMLATISNWNATMHPGYKI